MQSRIVEFIEEIKSLRLENQQKRDLVARLVEKLALAEKERDEYYESSIEYKNENKVLKRNFREVQNRYKLLLMECFFA